MYYIVLGNKLLLCTHILLRIRCSYLNANSNCSVWEVEIVLRHV